MPRGRPREQGRRVVTRAAVQNAITSNANALRAPRSTRANPRLFDAPLETGRARVRVPRANNNNNNADNNRDNDDDDIFDRGDVFDDYQQDEGEGDDDARDPIEDAITAFELTCQNKVFFSTYLIVFNTQLKAPAAYVGNPNRAGDPRLRIRGTDVERELKKFLLGNQSLKWATQNGGNPATFHTNATAFGNYSKNITFRMGAEEIGPKDGKRHWHAVVQYYHKSHVRLNLDGLQQHMRNKFPRTYTGAKFMDDTLAKALLYIWKTGTAAQVDSKADQIIQRELNTWKGRRAHSAPPSLNRG
jgi:hypothetical protein